MPRAGDARAELQNFLLKRQKDLEALHVQPFSPPHGEAEPGRHSPSPLHTFLQRVREVLPQIVAEPRRMQHGGRNWGPQGGICWSLPAPFLEQ